MLKLEDVIQLKLIAQSNAEPTCRICLHESDDNDIHEMLIVHMYPQKVGPLKQNKSSLSYHVLYGSAEIILYDENGEEVKQILLGTNKNEYQHVRLDSSIYRSIESKSDYFIVLEVASGPFKDSDTIWLETVRRG